MAPVFLFRAPSPALHDVIACQQIIRLRFSPDRPVPPKPYWPRPAISLAFYPRDAERVQTIGDDAVRQKPRAALIGQPTILTQRQGGHDFSVYQIEFCPGALYRLTGLPADLMTDRYLDAEAIFPASFRPLIDGIEDTDDPEIMIRLAESWFWAQQAVHQPRCPEPTSWHRPSPTAPHIRKADGRRPQALCQDRTGRSGRAPA